MDKNSWGKNVTQLIIKKKKILKQDNATNII